MKTTLSLGPARGICAPDAGEQVVLGLGGLDQALHQLELLGRPDLLLQSQRHREPVPVRIDLGGVGEQGLVPSREELAARHLGGDPRSEEHTSELQSLMRISYAVFCLNKKNKEKK